MYCWSGYKLGRFGCRAQLGPARLDRAQSLGEPGPGPGLDFLVTEGGLASSRFQVLEPGIRFLDQQQLVRFALSGHQRFT